MKVPRKYYLFLLVGIILLIILEYFKPQPVNWSRTFSSKHEIPFGTEAIYRMLKSVFPGQHIDRSQTSFYTLEEDHLNDVLIIGIANSITYDPPSLNKLLRNIEGGNDLFLSAYEIESKLLDTLGLKMNEKSLNWQREPKTLRAYDIKTRIDTISKLPVLRSMSSLKIIRDSLFSKVRLGYMEDSLNFVRIKVGSGNIFIHTEPLAFSNYYFLKGDTYEYSEAIFKHMPNRNILWDHYHNANLLHNQTPLKIILQSTPLRYSYYTLIVLMVLYILLAGRREQRPIPILEKPANTSVDFIQTISNLYLNSKNHKAIALHRIHSFKNYLKDHFFVNWKLPQNEIIKKLGKKSGIGEKSVSELLDYISFIENKKQVTQKELIHLNKLIENFTNKYYGL